MSRARRWWRLHLALVFGLSICALGFAVELGRGLDGHLSAWVYVLEWPLFAVGGSVVWWRLVHDQDTSDGPSGPASRIEGTELESWREHVARVESGDASDLR